MTTQTVILCPDSFVAIKGFPSAAFDVTITDPPFDDHVHANITSGTAMREVLTGQRKGGIPKVDLSFDPVREYGWIQDLVQGTRRWVIVFCAAEAFGDIRRVAGPSFRRSAWWYKPNAQGQMTADRPAAAGEGLAVLHQDDQELEGVACVHPGKPRWNGKGSYGFWPCNGTRGEKGRHPNQKPLDLCLKLVALFSDRGETVFDPFAGSGRIGEACAMLGRSYWGLERDPEWVVKANQRIAAVTQTMTDEQALSLCTAKKSEIIL